MARGFSRIARNLEVAAKVFQIIGTVCIVLGVLIAIILLPLISRLLKNANRSLAKESRTFSGQMRSSLEEMDTAKAQIDAAGEVTVAVKQGMKAAIGAMDGLRLFLESNVFQVGLPVLIWTAVLVVSITRGILPGRRSGQSKPAIKPIPPPSRQEDL
jgi:hypothetical protein